MVNRFRRWGVGPRIARFTRAHVILDRFAIVVGCGSLRCIIDTQEPIQIIERARFEIFRFDVLHCFAGPGITITLRLIVGSDRIDRTRYSSATSRLEQPATTIALLAHRREMPRVVGVRVVILDLSSELGDTLARAIEAIAAISSRARLRCDRPKVCFEISIESIAAIMGVSTFTGAWVSFSHDASPRSFLRQPTRADQRAAHERAAARG